jgi:arginine utilization regulatory protein
MEFYKELFEILIKHMDEGIQVIDSEGRTIVYNRMMEELEGLDGSEVIGRKLLEVFPSLNESTSTLCRVLKTGEEITDRCQNYFNKKGHQILAVNTTIPIKRDEDIIGAVEISKDFTKIKELYDRIINLTGNTDKVEDKTENEDITGCSPSFMYARNMAAKASSSSSTVLIYGETGTGKEVFARFIHNNSKRSNKPFLAVNCAAIPDGLLEGILFGTVKGSFTGAVDRPGLFEQADGGTLMLDEINSMSTMLQAKLLRVLQESYVRRVGDVKDIPLDVRIIATTNEPPMDMVRSGRLRKDLYYRLSIVNITIPPLRERKEDIALFVKEFIRDYNLKLGREAWDISDEVYNGFMSYSWPGNVRELRNYIEGAVNMLSGHIIGKECFSPLVQEQVLGISHHEMGEAALHQDLGKGLEGYIEDVEKTIISKTLSKTQGNISEASRILKIKRQTLQHKIKKYELNK